MLLQPGTHILNGKYRIERLLGEGASAEVYLVYQEELGDEQALKVLKREIGGKGSTEITKYRDRFRLEGRLQAQLRRNTRVLQVFGTETFDGLPVLVMEYAEGRSLEDELGELAKREKRMAWLRCAELLRDVAEGLQGLHARGWVHRDVKPSNILLERPLGRAKIGDLGLAQTEFLSSGRSDGQAGPHPGTQGYLSPEHGVEAAMLTPAADIFSLGTSGYRMLTGLWPPPAARGHGAPEIEGDAPAWLKGLIQRMLAWDYRERPQNGGAVAEEIARELKTEAEREAQRAARVRELRGLIEAALKAGELNQAAGLMEELTAAAPDGPELAKLGSQVYLAILAETKRVAAAEQKRLADEAARLKREEEERQRVAALAAEQKRIAEDAARQKREEEERQRVAAIAAEQKRVADEVARLKREEEERQRLAAFAAEQKRLADEAARLKREEEERQRLAAVAVAEAKRKAETNQRLRRISADRVALILSPGVEMEFVQMPAGEFVMGSDKAQDSLVYDDELPQHKLKLPEFWIGKAPVTVAQFAAFVKAAGYKTTAETVGYSWHWTGNREKIEKADWGHPGGPATGVEQKQNHPVTHVSWDDTVAFCAWASKVGGGDVLLPSEAEWEKAARGTDGRIYPWGNDTADDTRLNYNQNVKDTTPVGRFGAKGNSPYGCDDMAGNVREWTRSLWGKDVSKPEFGYPYATRQTEREEMQAGRDVLRVLRGGSFDNVARDVRCAFRSGGDPDFRGGYVGFRVILRPPSL